MERPEFLALAGQLQDAILERIEEFAEAHGLPFDVECFLRNTPADIAELSVAAMFFGTGAYSPEPEPEDQSKAA